TLRYGFFVDDYSILLVQEGIIPGLHRRADVYHFLDGDPATTRRFYEHGPFPWWTLPELKLSFLRPLSGALLVADDRIFRHHPVGWHLHSLAWYFLLVVAAGLVLRRALAGRALVLALALFAVNDSHAMALAWIANRHSAVAVALALLGLWAHLRWREARWT